MEHYCHYCSLNCSSPDSTLDTISPPCGYPLGKSFHWCIFIYSTKRKLFKSARTNTFTFSFKAKGIPVVTKEWWWHLQINMHQCFQLPSWHWNYHDISYFVLITTPSSTVLVLMIFCFLPSSVPSTLSKSVISWLSSALSSHWLKLSWLLSYW